MSHKQKAANVSVLTLTLQRGKHQIGRVRFANPTAAMLGRWRLLYHWVQFRAHKSHSIVRNISLLHFLTS